MTGRSGRLLAFTAVGVLALASAAGSRLVVHLPATVSSVDTEVNAAAVAPGTTTSRIKAPVPKHGRTAPLLPAAALAAVAAVALFGWRVADGAVGAGRSHRRRSSRCSRAPPAVLSI